MADREVGQVCISLFAIRGGVKKSFVSQSRLESGARAGDSPLDENNWSP